MAEIIFEKKLCNIDASLKLVVPMAGLKKLIPDTKTQYVREIQAFDTIGKQWKFRLSIRREDPNPRPEITGEWKQFAMEKRLQVDYLVTLSRTIIDGEEKFYIKAERKFLSFWLDVETYNAANPSLVLG